MTARQIAAARQAFIDTRASELRQDEPGMSRDAAVALATAEWEGE